MAAVEYLHPEAERVSVLASRLDCLAPRWPEVVSLEDLETRGALLQVVDALAAEEHEDWQEVLELAWSEHPASWDERAAWGHWHAAWGAEIAWRRSTPEEDAGRLVRSWLDREAS